MPPYSVAISAASRQGALLSLGHLRPVFLAAHIIGGLVGLPLLALTFLLSSKIPRQPALINFCITWSINSISYSLTALRGNVEDAPTSLCFAQAAMIYGAPPMSASAMFMVVLQIWRMFRDPTTRRVYQKRHCSEKAILVIRLSMPYIIYFIFFIISVVLQVKFPQSLDRRNGLYCTISGIPFRRWSVPIVSIVFLLLMMAFECSIVIRYRSARKSIVSSFPLASRTTSAGGLIIRIALFNVYLLVTFGASIVFLSGQVQAWAYMIQASVPLAAFVLFATQRDVLHAWCFWLQKQEFHSDDSMPPLRKPEADDDINLALDRHRNGEVQEEPCTGVVPSIIITDAPEIVLE